MRYFNKVTVTQQKLGKPDIKCEVEFNPNTGFATFITCDGDCHVSICETETLESKKAISFITFSDMTSYDNIAGMVEIKENTRYVKQFEHFDILIEFEPILSYDKTFKFTFASK